MIRKLHSLPGLIAGLLVTLLAVTGAVLSINPALDRLSAPSTPAITVADLASRVVDHYPGVERIVQKASGAVIVYYFKNDVPGSDQIDPATGQALAAYDPSAFSIFMTNLHRSFLMGDNGRAVAGISAVVMVLLTISGAFLLANRLGGWRKLLSPVRGGGWHRLHAEVGRLAVIGLLLSALTAAYLSSTTFGFVSDGSEVDPVAPTNVDGGTPAPVGSLAALKELPLSSLRELAFPYADDPTDVFTVTTDAGTGFVDQATGTMLGFTANNLQTRIYEFVFMLHTGEGLWWLALVLGLSALTVPFMAGTGAVIWWVRRQAMPHFAHNARPQAADVVILVGSEGNSTWGFARTLHDALTAQGLHVHTSAMNRFAGSYAKASDLVLMTATYGDGEAPASARDFLRRLEAMSEKPGYATSVLGFGDRQFPQFCQFARDVSDALAARGLESRIGLGLIDRQSGAEFTRWGTEFGNALGIDLTLDHQVSRPKSFNARLIERVDYGVDVQAPTTVFRFSLPDRREAPLLQRLFGLGKIRFDAGDLVSILPPGETRARYYSLASAARDGVIEICVRKQAGGICSTFLHGLTPGDEIRASIKPNPHFRPLAGSAPVILIGAGTGIGPLAGFIRHNRRHQPMHLYFGGRDPQSDFLYETELMDWVADKRLTRLKTAFSRVARKAYVQDRLQADAESLRHMISRGAQIMVCGGRDMAQGVRSAIEDIISPLGLNAGMLKAEGRYLEDVY